MSTWGSLITIMVPIILASLSTPFGLWLSSCSMKTWSLSAQLFNLGWTCNLSQPIEWGKSDKFPVVSLGLKRLCLLLLTLLQHLGWPARRGRDRRRANCLSWETISGQPTASQPPKQMREPNQDQQGWVLMHKWAQNRSKQFPSWLPNFLAD